MITLTLLHPLKDVPVQNWSFNADSTIRVGRSVDNDVVLYSAVVSRAHLEIRRKGSHWELVSLGTNGTYVDGKRVEQAMIADGMVIRLASSGPKIKILIDSTNQKTNLKRTEPERVLTRKQLSKQTLLHGMTEAEE